MSEAVVPTGLAIVVCGFDGSPQALDAARQAAALAEPDGRFVGVSSWDPGLAIHAGIHAGAVAAELREAATSALQRAAERQPDLEQKLMRGPDVACLLAAAAEVGADLICVGSHGESRLAGVVLGSVATALAHHAPCPVLIGRAGPGAASGGPVLHATDGSDEATAAGRLAAHVAQRAGSELRAIQIDESEGDVAGRIVAKAEEARASVLVLGSRGRSGLRSLGSVAERVAHDSPCSVLIARPKVHPDAG